MKPTRKRSTPKDTKKVSEELRAAKSDHYRIDTEWFWSRMRQLNLDREALGDLIGTYPVMVTRLLSGNRPIRVGEIPIWAEALQVTTAEIVSRLGVGPGHPARCAVAGTVGNNAAVTFDAPDAGRSTEAPGGSDPNVIGFEVVATSEALAVYDQGYLFVSPRTDVGADSVSRLCVLKLDAGASGIVARVLRLSDSGRKIRAAILGTGEIRDLDGVVSASPVRWVRLG